MPINTMIYTHNMHLKSLVDFVENDPHLKRIKNSSVYYNSPLLSTIAALQEGVITISGGRQIGKTTLLKQLMKKLLFEEKVDSRKIFFHTGELIYDHKELIEQVRELVQSMPHD